MTEWSTRPLGQLMHLDIQTEVVDPEATYPIVGVLNRGRGLLRREAIAGSQTKYATLNRVRLGQVVYSRLKAFEGAITVATDLLSHNYASQEFPTFTCGPDLLPRYFRLVTTLESFWDDLRAKSKGMGGRRERVKPGDFLDLLVAVPPLEVQRRIVDLVGALDAQIVAMDSEREAAWAFLAALREDSLANGKRVPLAQVCSIDSRLVDPREADYSGLPHIGVEAIEKVTGRVRAVRTAQEDGLISGKYLYGDADVIYAKIRPNLRKVALPGGQGLCSADAYPLRAVPGLPASLLRETLLLDSVVEAAVASSGRTKMPKVNRRELFAIEVPLGEPGRWQQLAGPLEAVRLLAEVIEDEVGSLRHLRSALLTDLMSGVITLTEAYELSIESV